MARQRCFDSTTKDTKNTKARRGGSRGTWAPDETAGPRNGSGALVLFVFFVVPNNSACGAQ